MKRFLGLTYAGGETGRAPGVRRVAAAGWRTLRVHTQGAWDGPRPALSRPWRWVVSALLVTFSLAVLGKEPALRDAVSGWVAGLWEPSAAAAEPATRPEAPIAQAWAYQPLALVSDGGLFMVSQDGRLEPADLRSLGGRLPVVTGVPVREVPDQMRVRLEAPIDVVLLRQVLAAPDADAISEINLEDPREIVLYLRDAAKVKLERGPQLARDLRRLAAVRADLRQRGVTAAVIDLRYLKQAVVKPRSGR